MCYDMCLRALDETIQTLGSLRFRRVGEIEASDDAAAELSAIVHELQNLRRRMDRFEGAHLDQTVKCSLCNTYSHHNHEKTEWRSACTQGGYDEKVAWSTREDGARYAMKPSSPYAIR